jgi:hypothetical protein
MTTCGDGRFIIQFAEYFVRRCNVDHLLFLHKTLPLPLPEVWTKVTKIIGKSFTKHPENRLVGIDKVMSWPRMLRVLVNPYAFKEMLHSWWLVSNSFISNTIYERVARNIQATTERSPQKGGRVKIIQNDATS